MSDADATLNTMHVGRHWPGTYENSGGEPTIEDECPCPTEPCGLVSLDRVDPDCPQHTMWKTIRNSHRAADCPGFHHEPPDPL